MPGGGEVPQPPPCAHSVPAHARKPRRPPFAPTHLARAAAHECARASPPAAPTPPPALVGASLRAPSRPSSPAPAPTAWEQPLARPLALRAPAHACAPTRARARAAAGRWPGFATTNGCVHFESVVRAPSDTVIQNCIEIRRHTGTTDLILYCHTGVLIGNGAETEADRVGGALPCPLAGAAREHSVWHGLRGHREAQGGGAAAWRASPQRAFARRALRAVPARARARGRRRQRWRRPPACRPGGAWGRPDRRAARGHAAGLAALRLGRWRATAARHGSPSSGTSTRTARTARVRPVPVRAAYPFRRPRSTPPRTSWHACAHEAG